MNSAIYRGRVMHQRLRPLRHRLSYGMFMLWLDLDELPALDARLRWFSMGRFNLFSFHPADHADGQAADVAGLRAQVQARLVEAGLPVGGAIRLLTMPRLLGYAFNPLSVWFCDAPDGRLQAIIYEVNNTFGERHSYLIEVEPEQRDATLIEQRSDKRLYVSPFLGMALRYRFRIEPPHVERPALSLNITVEDARAPEPAKRASKTGEAGGGAAPAAVLHARLDARRLPLTDVGLARLLVSYPLLTLKVIVGIHWEALRLWVKGAKLHERPAAPEQALTVVRRGPLS